MAIAVNTGFEVGASVPIDSRFVFNTISDMANYNTNLIPDVYFCCQKEDGALYTYNIVNIEDPTTGKWRKVEGSGFIIKQANDLELGGIKASEKSDTDTKYTMEVKIDKDTGKLYSAYDPSTASLEFKHGLLTRTSEEGIGQIYVDVNLVASQLPNYSSITRMMDFMGITLDDGTMVYAKSNETIDGVDYTHGLYRWNAELEEWEHQDYLTREEFQNHAEDIDKHVSVADRYGWNNKADGYFEDAQVDVYTSDFVGRKKYIIDSDYLYRVLMYGKLNDDQLYANKKDMSDHVNNKTLMKHLTEEQVGRIHTHANSEVLGKLTVSDDGAELLYDGKPVVNNDISNHLNNTDIHVTTEDKTKWNGHTSNTDIHVTTADKTKWNSKAETTDIPTKISQLENDSGILHDHTNKTVLDKFSESESGKLLYNNIDYHIWTSIEGKPTLNGVVIDGEKTSTDYNIPAKLDNEDILKLITDSNGKLMYNGVLIGSLLWDDITNKPKLNGVTIEGNKLSTDYNISDKFSNEEILKLLSDDGSGNLLYKGAGITSPVSSITWGNVTNKPFDSIDTTSLTIASGVLSLPIDSVLSSTSTKPVQNKVITAKLNDYLLIAEVDSKVGEAIGTELANYYTKTEIDSKLSGLAKQEDLHNHDNKTTLDKLSSNNTDLFYNNIKLLTEPIVLDYIKEADADLKYLQLSDFNYESDNLDIDTII